MSITVIPADDSIMTAPEPGLRRQVMTYSPTMMLVRHRLEAGWIGAKHAHPHEQMVYVLSGSLTFETPAGKFEVRAGDSFLIPGGVDHQASALEPSEVLDIFTPYRADYAPKA